MKRRITLTLSKRSFRLLEHYQHMLRVSDQPSSKQEIIVSLIEGLLAQVEDILPYEDILEVAE